MRYIPILFIVLVVACEQVAEVDLPEQEPQLTLSCFYKSGDTYMRAYLSNNLSILDTASINPIEGASMKLYENEVLMTEFMEAADTIFGNEPTGELDSMGYPIFETVVRRVISYYQIGLSTPLQVGNTYKITAEADGFPPIAATQKFPVAPTVSDIAYRPASIVSLGGELSDAFEFKIQDAPDEDNFYAMQIKKCEPNSSTFCLGKTTYSYTPNTAFGLQGNILLNDELFDGQLYDVSLFLNNTIDTAYHDLRIAVTAISHGGYFFAKSRQAYIFAGDNPFAEPVIIHTNVENGQGIFSIESRTEVLVE